MRNFIIAFLIVGALGAGGYYYLLQEGKLEVPETVAIIRTPESYHMLEGVGGVPMGDATEAGLATGDYAYLRALEPIQIGKGISMPERVKLGGKSYELAYKFNSTSPRDQVLEFNLLGGWDELHFGFGFEDDEGSDPHDTWAIEFIVQVDGEAVAGAKRLTPVGKPYFTKVNVSGANRVTFVSRRIGSANPFAPVLVDPFVLKLDQE